MYRNSKPSTWKNKHSDGNCEVEERIEKSGSSIYSKRDNRAKITPVAAAPTSFIESAPLSVQPEITRSKKRCGTNSIQESQNEGIQNFQDDGIYAKNKWIKIWMWHTWINSQPSGEKKTETIASLVLYFLFFIIACFPMYLVMKNQNTFTSVEIVSVPYRSPIPDAIVCPPKNTCVSCPHQFQHYNFTHDVWWNANVLRLLNISEYHLNLLASTLQRQAFSEHTVEIPKELRQYIESAKELVDKGEGPDYESSPNLTVYQMWNCSFSNCRILRSRHLYVYPLAELSRKIDKSSFTINDFWYLIVKFPGVHYYSGVSNHQLQENQTGLSYQTGVKFFHWKEYIKPKMTWVNNSYCLLFKNDKEYSFWAGHFFKTIADTVTLEIKHGKETTDFGWRYWIGNLSTQSVFLPHFQKIKNIYNTRVNLNFLKIKDYTTSSPKYTVCHTDISVLKNRHKTCKKNILTEYTYAYSSAIERIYTTRGATTSHVVTFVPTKTKLVSKQNVYSPLSVFEIMGSIFCLFLGTSVYQILLVSLGFMSKKWLFFKSVVLKIMMCFLLFILAFILFYFDLSDHLKPKYSHQLAVAIGKHKLPTITFSTSSHPNFLNYTKLQELGISLSLLQYIHIAGTGHDFRDVSWYSTFPLHKKNLVISKEDMKKRLDIQSCDDSRQELHKEYKALAVKLGIDPTAPAYHVLNKLSLDKCMLIEYCLIHGVKHMDCCDNYFSYRPDTRENALVFDTSENFMEQDLGFPDIEIKFNYELWINQIPLHNYAYSIGNYSKVALHNFYGIAGSIKRIGSASLTKPDDKALIVLSVALSEEEIRKRIEKKECVKNSCYGHVNVPQNINFEPISALIRFKICGCYICFNHTEMKKNLEKQGKCCTPHKAVECLANPLLYPGENPDCPTTKATCSNPLPIRKINESEYCLNAYCSHIVAYKTNSTNCTEKLDIQCACDPKVHFCEGFVPYSCYGRKGGIWRPNNFISYTSWSLMSLDAIYANLELGVTKDEMRQYGCNVNIEAFKQPPCSLSEYSATKVIQSQSKQQGQLAIKLSRKSATNNFLVNRALQDRSYNTIEILGLLLGAYSLFVGLDLVSVVAFFTRFMLLSGHPLKKRFLDSCIPIEIHWMRLFRQFVPGLTNNSPQDPRDDNSSKQPINVQSMYSKVCVVSAVTLLLVGLTISVYAGAFKLVSEKEFNMNIVEEVTTKDFPSFAVCKNFENTSSIDAQINLGFIGIRCWVNMKEHSCANVFDLQVFTGQHFCWVACDTSRLVQHEGVSLSLKDFNFVFTVNRTFPYMTWYGHLSAISSYSEINPVITNEKDYSTAFTVASRQHVVHAYEEYRNFSCSFTQKTELSCPYCIEQSFNTTQCCIHHQNVTTDFLERKHQCPKVSYIEGQQTFFTSEWLKGSEIWNEIEPYRIVALKRMHPYVTEVTYTDRHSGAAKFALITGYSDLFLGISVLSIGGSFILWFIRYVRSMLKQCVGNEEQMSVVHIED